MNSIRWAMVLAAGAWGLAAKAEDKPAKKAGADFFDTAKVWEARLVLTQAEYQKMQPPAPVGGFQFNPVPVNPPKADPKRDSDRSVFGTEFPWVKASFSIGDETVEGVGLRYKGNSTYLAAARGLKRSFKVEFDHYDDALRFRGLKTLNLHCGVHDTSKLREAFAYKIFRECGVPAPRTAFAEVSLTVTGRHDRELLGLYTVTEQVNKPFLKAHYGTDKGLLMKPERVGGLDYLGDDWAKYQTTYQPKRDATNEEQTRVIAFTKLVNRGEDADFVKQIGSFLDVDAFLRFQAATALVANLDSFFTNGHNYYLYLHPETRQFHFIPWDTDLALGNFAFFGTADQQMDLSLNKPYPRNRLADRLMAVEGMKEKYRVILKELTAAVFTKERLLKELEVLEAATKEALVKESKAATARKEPGAFPGPFGGAKPPELRTFVEKRTASVTAQLADKSTGYAPQMAGFGPPGGGFGGFGQRPPRPGELLAAPVQGVLRLTDEQKKKLADLQKETDAKVDELLTPEQRKQLKQMREGGPPR
ncbi:CotH kinase family protein [Zavarzinella formosa]|uniref:CotH kinase family protein n=1 Tax=Zavarzinella formosa TaxID=360055 RepID=UPI0002DAA763|nr:CotH kinase family protein [Zavarzinella formosa]